MTDIPDPPVHPNIERPIDLTDIPDHGALHPEPLPEPEPVTRPGPEEPLEE